MKKKIILSLLIITILLTGCTSNKTKTKIDNIKFTNTAISQGYTVTDNTQKYQDTTYITSSTLAKISDEHEIEMVIYDSEETASKAQEQHINSFNLLKSSGSTINKESGKNYYHYEMISNNYYMISTRIDNTLIFSKVKLSDKDKVISVINNLDY